MALGKIDFHPSKKLWRQATTFSDWLAEDGRPMIRDARRKVPVGEDM